MLVFPVVPVALAQVYFVVPLNDCVGIAVAAIVFLILTTPPARE